MAPRAQTYVVAASATPLDLDRLRSAPGPDPDGETAVGVMPADALEEWLRGANPVVLTDDYAPGGQPDGADLPRAWPLTAPHPPGRAALRGVVA